MVASDTIATVTTAAVTQPVQKFSTVWIVEFILFPLLLASFIDPVCWYLVATTKALSSL